MLGGMHYVTYAPLAAAVSNAGGLGTITAVTQPSPEHLRKEIHKMRTLTDKPFAVNLSFLPAGNPPDYAAFIKVIIDEGVKVVETAGGRPGKWIAMLRDAGIYVIHKCVNARHGLAAVKDGACMLSIDGSECGGHPGPSNSQTGGFLLMAMVKKELGDVPFICSGGVGCGEQLAAALALGAEGVNMGTRFMATQEAAIHDNIKKALVESSYTQTTLIMDTLKNTERVFLNEEALSAQKAEKERPGDFEVVREFVSGSK
ncbi:NADH:quinone reductase [Durusdinium trenchii]|uniref:NADH:quinone reductase n=1 Tax=Durusdinium trenchii TaxID=1381693 RepID=A0ABP0PTE6_9DINO